MRFSVMMLTDKQKYGTFWKNPKAMTMKTSPPPPPPKPPSPPPPTHTPLVEVMMTLQLRYRFVGKLDNKFAKYNCIPRQMIYSYCFQKHVKPTSGSSWQIMTTTHCITVVVNVALMTYVWKERWTAWFGSSNLIVRHTSAAGGQQNRRTLRKQHVVRYKTPWWRWGGGLSNHFIEHWFTISGALLTNYTHCFGWYVIIHPGSNVNGGLTKPPLKLGMQLHSTALDWCNYVFVP